MLQAGGGGGGMSTAGQTRCLPAQIAPHAIQFCQWTGDWELKPCFPSRAVDLSHSDLQRGNLSAVRVAADLPARRGTAWGRHEQGFVLGS